MPQTRQPEGDDLDDEHFAEVSLKPEELKMQKKHEKRRRRPAKVHALPKPAERSLQSDLPFTFPAPVTYAEFLAIVENRPVEDLQKIVQRILIC